MDLKLIRKEGVVIFQISGEIDLSCSQSLKESIEKEPFRNIIVDLEKVSYMDSSGLAIFIEVLKKIRQTKGHMVFSAPSARIKSLLEITKLDKIFTVCKDLNEAMDQIKKLG